MFAALTLAFVLGAYGTQSAQPDEDAVAAVREVLDLNLADYPSARVREVRIVTRPSNDRVTLAACGWVNSRTRSGGYGGWRRFVITNRNLELEGGAYFSRAWAVWCDGDDVIVVSPDVTDRVAPSAS